MMSHVTATTVASSRKLKFPSKDANLYEQHFSAYTTQPSSAHSLFLFYFLAQTYVYTTLSSGRTNPQGLKPQTQDLKAKHTTSPTHHNAKSEF